MDNVGLDIHRKCRREREELQRRLDAHNRTRAAEGWRIAELMAWCATDLGNSVIHHKIREVLHIPDSAYPWQLPHAYTAGQDPSGVAASAATTNKDVGGVGATCTCAVADGHLASQHTDCGGGPAPCGGCHSCLLRQMHHAQRTALRAQWSVACPACHMPAGKACTDAAGLLPEHMNHPARAAAYAVSGAGQAGEEVDRG